MIDNLFEIIQRVGKKPYVNFVSNWSSSSITSNSWDFSNSSKGGFVFKQYKSLEDAFNEIEKIRNKPNKENYEVSALNFVSDAKYRNFTALSDNLKIPNTNFDKIKKISKVVVENIKTLINLGGLYKNDRIKITENTNGVFDFGLASLGLYRPVEFYSEKLKNDIVDGVLKNPYQYQELENGVVLPNDVNKKVINNIDFFIYKKDGKEYYCDRRQRGATKVFNNFSDECILKENSDGIILTYYRNNQDKVFNGRDKIRLKYASNNKKCYLIYEKKDDSVKYVDIFMPINFVTAVNDSSRALFLLPAYLISATLEEYGIQTRISALRIGSNENNVGNVLTTISIPVKEYEEPPKDAFDKIYHLLATSNYAGNFFAFFKIIFQNNGVQAQPTGWVDSNFTDIHYSDRKYMNLMLQRYKNWIEANKDEPFVFTKVNNNNFQFALNTTAFKIADNNITYENILNYIHNIFYAFYYYMDFLAIEMVDMNEFVKNIYKRITEDDTFNKIFERPSDKKEIKNLIRQYVIAILVEKYQTVSGGFYSDNQEQINKKENTFKEKVLLLNEAVNNL
jgi:hypothetical protein